MNRLLLVATSLGMILTLMATAYGDGFTDLGGRFDFVYGDGGGPGNVPNSTGQETSADGQMVKLFGDFGPITGADWQFGFVIYWNGSYIGPINPGDHFVADVDFDVHATGGTLQWSFYARMSSDDFAQISPVFMPVPESGHVSGVEFVSPEFSSPGNGANYESYLHIEWTGYSPTDTLTFSIPHNSVDVTFVPVPEPATAVLALMGAGLVLTGLRRRRCVTNCNGS